MVRDFTNSAPLLTIRKHQVQISSVIHTHIWILRECHLLTLEPPKEGLSKSNMWLTSMPGHVINPPLHTWLGRRRQVKHDLLRLHQWDFLQDKGSQDRTKSKVLQPSVLYLGQLTFHLY